MIEFSAKEVLVEFFKVSPNSVFESPQGMCEVLFKDGKSQFWIVVPKKDYIQYPAAHTFWGDYVLIFVGNIINWTL